MLKSSRILLATTAFVATTTAASATTVSTTSTVSYTTNVSGPITVTSAGVISSTGAFPAITVAGTSAASNTITNNGIIRSDYATATIAINTTSNTTISNNAGASIINTAGDTAILSEVATNVTINNAGTITGAITTSGTTTTINNSGTITGNINHNDGPLTFNQSAGLLNGNINATSVTADALNLSGGTISGTVNLGDGIDTVRVTGGTLTGTLDLGAGDDVLTYSGTTGSLKALVGGSGNDTFNVSGTTSTFTSGGAISGIENINVSGTANVGHAITGLNNLRVGTGGTFNANQGFSTNSGGALYVSGTMNIAAGQVVSTSNVFNTGVIGFAVSDSTSAGRIDIGDAAGTFSGGSVTVNFGANAGYIASGTTYKIVSSTGVAATLPSLTTTTNGLYTYQLTRVGASNEDISLTILRKDTASLVTSEAGKGIAGVIETVSGSATGDLKTINSVINQQSSAAGVNNVIESLTPSLDTGAAMASIDFGGAVNTNASTRLAALRGSALSGVATGDASLQNRFWVKGFGNVTEQDDNKGNRGYDASTAGASFGVDSDAVVDGYTTGLGFSYGKTKVDSNASSNAETDVDSYMASLYGSKVYGDGMFINGMVNLGYNKYDFERQAIGFTGKTKGDTDGLQGGVKLEVGRDYAMGSTLFTPLAGLQYTYLKMDEYTEKGPTAQTVDPDAMSTVDASLGLQIAHDIALENGATLRPAVRAKYVYRMGDDSLEANSQFVAGGAAFTTQGVEADRSSVNLGAGVTLLSAGGLDMGIDYDADIRSNLTGHTGQVKVRWVF